MASGGVAATRGGGGLGSRACTVLVSRFHFQRRSGRGRGWLLPLPWLVTPFLLFRRMIVAFSPRPAFREGQAAPWVVLELVLSVRWRNMSTVGDTR